MAILRANKNDAYFIRHAVEQGAGETDWRQFQARIKGRGQNLGVLNSSTNTTLECTAEVTEGDTLYLKEGIDTHVKKVTAGAAGAAGAATTDIFGDGSGVALYQLNGNALDTGGTYNATWTGTEQYAPAKFGDGALFDGSSYLSSAAQSGVQAISFWIKPTSSTARQMWVRCNGIEIGRDTFDTEDIILIYPGSSSARVYNYVYPADPMLIVATISGDLYANGILLTPSSGRTWARTVTALNIGGSFSSYSGTNSPNGTIIDQARLFNKNTFTQEELDLLYFEGYVVDISSAGFTNAPTFGAKVHPEISVSLEETTDRCLCEDLSVTITQAFNDTLIITSDRTGVLIVGDTLTITVDSTDIDVELLTVSEQDLGGGTYEYTVTFAAQASPASAAYIKSRAITLQNPTTVSDWDGEYFTVEYDAVLKRGRAAQYRVDAQDTGSEIVQVNVDLYKEVV